MRPTIVDVAERAGVSKGLVSLALNDRPGVADATRRRIRVAAEQLGWTPSIRARALSVDRAFAIGLVLARDPSVIAADPFFPAFIAGVEGVMAARRYAVTLALVPSPEREAEEYRRLVAEGRVDGVILTDLLVDDARPALLASLGLPAITLGHPDAPGPLAAVALDDGPGIRAAVEHLVSLGHRRIAHVAGADCMLHGLRRRAEFETAMRDADLDPSRVVPTDFSAADGARATAALLDAADPPTAIVYANDPMAIAGIGVAQSRGVRVPDGLSVTGFDGSDIGAHLFPALTTVATEVGAWGEAAARTLLALIDGEDPADVELPPARLVVRDSTAPAAPASPASPARPDPPASHPHVPEAPARRIVPHPRRTR